MMISRKVASLAGAFAVASVALAVACGGGNDGVGSAKLPAGVRSEGVEHEACTEAGNRVDALDANGDGKPDIKRVYDKSGHEVCRITDLNHDGKPDMYEYYDASGQLRRREADFDDTGVINMVEYYDAGKLVRKELDTTGQHRIDTWDYYDPASGKLTKRERDTTNDGRVDQWWTYDGDKVTIAIDKSGDGKPEPDQTIVIGGDDKKDGGAGSGAASAVDASTAPLPAQPQSAGNAGIAPTSPSGPTTDGGIGEGGAPRRRENRGGKK